MSTPSFDRSRRTALWRAALVLLLALVPCLLYWRVYGAAVAWLMGGLATLGLSLFWVQRLMPGALRSVGRRLLAALVISAVAAAAAWFGSAPFVGLGAIIAGGLAGATAGAVVLWWLNAVLSLQLQDLRFLVRKSND